MKDQCAGIFTYFTLFIARNYLQYSCYRKRKKIHGQNMLVTVNFLNQGERVENNFDLIY